MQQAYYLPWHHLYRSEGGTYEQEFAYLWPFSQAIAATTALAGIPTTGAPYAAAVREHIEGLRWYWNGRSKPPGYLSGVLAEGGGWKYYDDQEWIGLQLIRGYRMLGDRWMLGQAARLFALVVHGWDANRRHPCPGGVWWTQRPFTFPRATVSNAPAAELGLELYQLTRKREYLSWARRMYHWVRVCLREGSGLYADNINLSGYVDKSIWIYNQGTMLGAEVLLYQITREASYLQRAQEAARNALTYFTAAQLQGQPPFFFAIFADNLMRLNAVAPDPSYRNYLQEYGDRAWSTDREAETGLFDFHDSTPTRLLQQAAMTQLYSYLAWDGSLYAPPR
jgi:Glycosyl hydrolase family 76